MRIVARSLLGVAIAMHLAVAPIAYSTHAFALTGDVKLPAPYVSRALDAVLVPIDDTVRKTFALSPKDSGVMVLAVQPNGVAAKQGIVAGDVISQIHGHKIVNPIDVDTIVYYWIQKGDFIFLIDYWRNGTVYNSTGDITLALFEEVISIASIASWESWSVSTSFSYSEFYSEYSEELTESYSSSETIIEETASSEEFSEEVTSEETSDSADEDGDGISDADDTDDDNDGVADSEDTDDDGDGVDDSAEASDDSGDDGSDDVADDGGDDADDGGDDSGGDDSGGEEEE